MKIIEVVKFNKQEVSVFERCQPWLFLMESESGNPATDEEKKALSSLINGNPLTIDNLNKALEVIIDIDYYVRKRKSSWESMVPNLPENSVGVIMKPRVAAQAILEACDQAVAELSEAGEIITKAMRSMRGSDILIDNEYENDDS